MLHRSRSQLRVLSAALAGGVLLAACGGSGAKASNAPKAASNNQTVTLSIGVFPALRPLELVRQEHWLEQAGYHVTWHDFVQGIPAEAAAMASGAINFAEADTSGIEQVAAKSPGLMWYIANGTNNYVAIVTRKGSGIHSFAQLRGKRVGGVVPNTAPTAVLQMGLAKAGLTLSDLNGFNVVGPSQPAAIQNGSIDAAASYVPYSTEIVTSGTGHLLATASQLYGKTWLGGGIVVAPSFAKAHPQVVVAVLRAVARADQLIEQHPSQAYAALAQASGTSTANVAYSYQHDLVSVAGLVPSTSQMISQSEVLEKFGALKVPDVTSFVKSFVHPEFAQQAAG